MGLNRVQELTIIRNQLGDVAGDDLEKLSVVVDDGGRVAAVKHTNGKELKFNHDLLKRRATHEVWAGNREKLGVGEGSTTAKSVVLITDEEKGDK